VTHALSKINRNVAIKCYTAERQSHRKIYATACNVSHKAALVDPNANKINVFCQYGMPPECAMFFAFCVGTWASGPSVNISIL
jgi:hypothetical protein